MKPYRRLPFSGFLNWDKIGVEGAVLLLCLVTVLYLLAQIIRSIVRFL